MFILNTFHLREWLIQIFHMAEGDGGWKSFSITTIFGSTFNLILIWKTTKGTSSWEGDKDDQKEQGLTFLTRNKSTKEN